MSELTDCLTGSGLIAMGAGQAAAEHDAFAGSTMTVAGLLAVLGAQEADKAAAWRLADIADMRALLGDAAPATGEGLTLTALDAAWATLSRALIAHHAAVEAAGDAAQDAAICAFYRASTARRELTWPI
jgi:hypothetical protein